VADRGDDVVLGCLTMRTLIVVLSLVVSCVTVRAQGADGFALFMRNWTVAETGSEGLGPLFNEASCSACHWVGGGARIRLRAGGEVSAAGLLVRLTDEAGRRDPHYGVQVQNKAVAGMAPEGIISLQALKTGDALTRFVITLRRRQAAQLSAGHVPSVRMAPALDAVAAIGTISEASILARADPDDADGDGISGRAHMLRRAGGGEIVGRFNWKATEASARSQIATALRFDMGLSTSLQAVPAGDCMPSQADCLMLAARAATTTPDVSDAQLDGLDGFVQSLGSAVDESRLPASDLFMSAGCGKCHVPQMDTAAGAGVMLYSNLLLHDMGPGLASAGGEGDASAREWRTTPLVGFRGHIPGHRYLHDGRAANIDEAIRWHGGEAAKSRDAYLAMAAADRLALTGYVQALLTAMELPPALDEALKADASR
jgi:CxxC motif-containing protein (DUF1111 family)